MSDTASSAISPAERAARKMQLQPRSQPPADFRFAARGTAAAQALRQSAEWSKEQEAHDATHAPRARRPVLFSFDSTGIENKFPLADRPRAPSSNFFRYLWYRNARHCPSPHLAPLSCISPAVDAPSTLARAAGRIAASPRPAAHLPPPLALSRPFCTSARPVKGTDELLALQLDELIRAAVDELTARVEWSPATSVYIREAAEVVIGTTAVRETAPRRTS
jgi:hypothetical protein